MRKKSFARPTRLPARGLLRAEPRGVGLQGAEAVTCCKCRKPLPNLPRYLARSQAGSGDFQCEDCFYRGTGLPRSKRPVISSSRAAYWQQLAEGLERGDFALNLGQRRAA